MLLLNQTKDTHETWKTICVPWQQDDHELWQFVHQIVACIFTNSAPLGRVGHRVAMFVCLWVCLSVCLRHWVQFFSRPLIGPEITWSVPGLSLVDPAAPFPPPLPKWEAGIWSCDLRANERPRKKLHLMAQTNRQTHSQTDGHGDSMTNSAQRGQVGEKYFVWWALPYFSLIEIQY